MGTPPIDIQAAFTGYNNGNTDAIGNIYTYYYRDLLYFAKGVLKQDENAKDIVAEVFSKLFDKAGHFSTISELKGFLYTVTRNKCMDHFRQIKKHNNHQPGLVYHLSDNGIDMNEVTRSEILGEIYRQMELLPGKMKQVIKLLLIDNKPVSEVALEMNIDEKTVRSQKANAIKIIKANILKRKLFGWILLIYCLMYLFG